MLPGLEPGEARLHADVLEANRYALSAQIADDQSPTVGATREFGLATDSAGATLNTFEQATPFLGTFSGTFVGYGIHPLTPAPFPSTLIGAYAYVGTTPPTAGRSW